MVEIAPSILSADWTRLGEEVAQVEAAGARIIHVDVMDGHFVPNITIGLPVVRALRKHTELPLDVHLMISEPGRYAEQFVEAGARMVSVHVEADQHLHRTLDAIRAAGAQAGIAINPATSLAVLDDALPFADYVVLMTVNPGFGGQRFIKHSFDKLRRLRGMIDARNLNTLIEIDGGVDLENAAQLASAGADILVAGSAIFGANDAGNAVCAMREVTTAWV